ncbi:hypothetical protein TNCT_577921 [Trichonephila clavata]|uniref:C2H2-type domain-containing protein n=1 Tax=Trichonephila clavata TaxID=2740835 RepID=A0A8X6JKE8_TRICU|nr:hypothetical protein TNCT_577921 [Trichonephila clavata]
MNHSYLMENLIYFPSKERNSYVIIVAKNSQLNSVSLLTGKHIMKLGNSILVIFVLELSRGKIISRDTLNEYLLMNLMSKNRPKFNCHICHKLFTTRRRRDTHLETHSDVRNLYSCPKCDRKFTWVDSLRRHIKIAHFLED